MNNKEEQLLHSKVTHSIIGAAMEVHRTLCFGYLESVYQAALTHEFKKCSLQFTEQGVLEVIYKDKIVGTFRYDFLVEECVIVEIKAVRRLSDADEAQLLNYLRGTGIQVGLLLNFGGSSLRWKRRVWSRDSTGIDH